ncbi:hypothetical protein IMG5_191370 [Ichthyophthirius multifiliis]|uniref:Uncharacterized protein n=1 Tax=Ichthyophthirius multifiliis TaxID=5932 RepID=G0R4D3_ICHMU|nr:hypothetical protein IMG5_191370 [Ichthyophthirius multifiliis]EGR27672.1 hypothetical protein IMG5_191370 [Ichthyophthirius multifiliis]|eukprot:XP_004025124.1 hypothetical protein IMG5_191370 [Ichthyophthirius multifiliis]
MKQTQQSQYLWENQLTGKFYLLNNETGLKTQVHKTGEYIKKFNEKLTGQVGYKERIEKAKENPGFMPFKAYSLQYDQKKCFYTPQMDKFEGYAQFRSPRTQPYYNQEKELKLNSKKRLQVKEQEKKINLKDEKNKSLFSYSGTKKFSLGTSFITGNMTDYQKSLKKKEIPVLKYMSHEQKTIKLNENLKGTKIINEKLLQTPNTHLLEKKKKQQNQTLNESLSPQKIEIEDIISKQRYINKVQSINQKTFPFKITSDDIQDKMNAFCNLENTRTQNIDLMYTRIGGLQTKTFEKDIKINFNKYQNDQQVRTLQDIEKDLQRKKQELEGFKLPDIQEKNTVITKGRFGFKIPSDQQQYNEGKRIIMISRLSHSQALVLMEISILLKQYKYVIELHENYEKYTGLKRPSFSYEKLTDSILGLVGEKSQQIEKSKNTIMQFRKLLNECEQNTEKKFGFLNEKLGEIRSFILDKNFEAAYNNFNQNFLHEKEYYRNIKREMNQGMYTIEDRRNNINETLDKYELHVINNFEEIDKEQTLNNRLRKVVYDGMLRIKIIRSKFLQIRRKIAKLKDQKIEFTETGTYQEYLKELEYIKMEVNKILGKPSNSPVDVKLLFEKLVDEDKIDNPSIQNLSIYLGEMYCDVCYIPLPKNLIDIISETLDIFNDDLGMIY